MCLKIKRLLHFKKKKKKNAGPTRAISAVLSVTILCVILFVLILYYLCFAWLCITKPTKVIFQHLQKTHIFTQKNMSSFILDFQLPSSLGLQKTLLPAFVESFYFHYLK